MALSTVEKFVYALITFFPARRLRKNMDKKLIVLEGLIDDLEKYSKQADDVGTDTYRELYSRMLFISLLDYDVALQLYDSAREFDVRRKNYRVRQLCLLLHEGFDDLPSVLGHRFRLAVGTLPNGQLHLEKLGAAVKAITKLGKRHEQLLKQVRAEAVAHREHNALKQLEVHRLIPVDEIQSLAMEFDVQLSELNGVLILILKDLGNPAVIISHVGAALDRDRHK